MYSATDWYVIAGCGYYGCCRCRRGRGCARGRRCCLCRCQQRLGRFGVKIVFCSWSLRKMKDQSYLAAACR
eukprot:1350265-Amphidinium_carterae.1